MLLDANIKGFGFNVLICRLETFILKSAAAVSVRSKKFYKLVANLNSFNPSDPYLIIDTC